jgi:CRISPR-associated protein Csd2
VLPLDLAITRQARTTEERMETGTTEMGRKPLIPYGLYRAHGYFNPFLAKEDKGTGVSQKDLEALWEALSNLFDFDRSAARGEMAVRGLWVFTHDNEKGNAPAHKLFELIKTPSIGGSPRSFTEYESRIDKPEPGKLDSAGFPGVTLTRLV